MKIKFGKFERVAGLFVLIAIVGSITSTVFVAVKQGWLAKKVELKTKFKTGDGLHVGTLIQMAGLRAGSVRAVNLETNNEVVVVFELNESFFKRVKEDSVAQVVRPFIIGEKVIDITVGSSEGNPVQPGALLNSRESTDLMDLISGRELGQYLETMKNLAENMRFLAENMFNQERSKAMVEIVDQLPQLIKNVNSMSVKMVELSNTLTEKKHLATTLKNVSYLTEEIGKLAPTLLEKAPDFGTQMVSTLDHVNKLTKELQLLIPALREIAPDLPKTSRRTVEAIDELVVTLKALQKNFMLRGKVQEVREEEAQERRPANKEEQ